MEGFTEYTLTFNKGSRESTEWWKEKDWEDHRKHIKELKASGELGKPYDVTLLMSDFRLFEDQPSIPVSEWKTRVLILDLGNFQK